MATSRRMPWKGRKCYHSQRHPFALFEQPFHCRPAQANCADGTADVVVLDSPLFQSAWALKTQRHGVNALRADVVDKSTEKTDATAAVLVPARSKTAANKSSTPPVLRVRTAIASKSISNCWMAQRTSQCVFLSILTSMTRWRSALSLLTRRMKCQ